MAQRIADRRHRWTAILVFIAGSPLAAQDIAGENCATPVVGDIGLLQTNTEELASCIAAGPTPGSGVMCDARTRSVVPTTTLYRTCADLEEQRCSLMRAFDDRLRQCAALLASDRGDAAASVLGAADIFMRRMRRFDDARRLVVVPEEFAHRLAEPLATTVGNESLSELAKRFGTIGCAGCAASDEELTGILRDEAAVEECRSSTDTCSARGLLGVVYREAQASMISFLLSVQAFTLETGLAALGDLPPQPAAPPPSTSDDDETVQALLAAANTKAGEQWDTAARNAASKIPDTASLRNRRGMGRFALAQVNSIVNSVRYADSMNGNQLLGENSIRAEELATGLSAAELLTATTTAEKQEALQRLANLSNSSLGVGTRNDTAALVTLGAIWLESATGGTDDPALQASLNRTVVDILQASVMNVPSLRGSTPFATPAGIGYGVDIGLGNVFGIAPGQGSVMLGGLGESEALTGPLPDAIIKAPTPPPSARASGQCPNDMTWVMDHIRTPELRVPEAYVSIDEVIDASGGLDRAVLLARAQCREDEDAYSVNRANTALRDAMPGTYREVVTAFADKLLLCRAYSEALECRRALQ